MECEGAYIEVERENNGFEARWCGNRVTQVILHTVLAICIYENIDKNDIPGRKSTPRDIRAE